MIRFPVLFAVITVLMVASSLRGQDRPSFNNTRRAEMLRNGEIVMKITVIVTGKEPVPITMQIKIVEAGDVYIGEFKIPKGVPPSGKWKIDAQETLTSTFMILDTPPDAGVLKDKDLNKKYDDARKLLEQRLFDVEQHLKKAKKTHMEHKYKGTYQVGVVSSPDATSQPDLVYQGKIDAIIDGTMKTKKALSDLPAGEKTPQMIKGWGQVHDPDGDCKISAKEGKVTFSIPGGTHDLWPGGGKVNAPRILQDAEGDFTVQVKVASTVKPDNGFFRSGTLLIWKDDTTFIRLDSACAHRGGTTFDFYCYLHVFKDKVRLVNEHFRPLKDQPTNLRLQRRNAKIVASFSQDEGKTWKSFGEKTVDLPQKLRVGVAAVNGTKAPFTVTLEDFKIDK